MKIGDSIATLQFSGKSEFRNLCLGHRTDEGQVLKLKILSGQSGFFDSLRNVGTVKIIDEKTVYLDKGSKEVWISGALCKSN